MLTLHVKEDPVSSVLHKNVITASDVRDSDLLVNLLDL